MSEYKYACPVCGQHMMCDSSQAGTVMECPTCFQKITAPQAPAGDDQKFVLTGTKVGDRPLPKIPTSGVTVVKNSPMGMIVVLVIVIGLLGAGAAVFAFRGTIFKPASAPVVAANDTDQPPAKNQPPPKPVVVAPPASDTNWTLNLDAAVIPDSPVAGRLHGQDFIIERASFRDGQLILREGTRGAVAFGLTVNFSGAQPEALSGQTINVSTNTDRAAPVTWHWKDGDAVQSEKRMGGYAMRLEFGVLANNRLPGKIYFCAPDAEKSYLMGTFSADARKPKPKAPKPRT